MRFIGVELDAVSGRIDRALHPSADIHVENFRDTELPEGRIDAVLGNVPFADLKLEYDGRKFSLHDYFFAKSLGALKPGGVLALVTSHFTLDKQNAASREYLAERADFLGAIRLPSDAFKAEGTSVVTDIVFLRKRAAGEPARHADPDWLGVDPLAVDGVEVPVNRYFLHHPEMVPGTFSRTDTLYGEGYSVAGTGDLAEQLREAIRRLPEGIAAVAPGAPAEPEPPPAFTPPPPLRHITEGSFFVGDDRAIYQVQGVQSVPVAYGGTTLTAGGTLTGKRLLPNSPSGSRLSRPRTPSRLRPSARLTAGPERQSRSPPASAAGRRRCQSPKWQQSRPPPSRPSRRHRVRRNQRKRPPAL
jgi:hypothetical protein